MDSLPTKKTRKKASAARGAARHKQGRDTVRATPPGPHAARTRPGHPAPALEPGRSAGRPTFDLIWDVALSRSLKQGCLCVV